jgi:MFS family permease
MVAAAIFLFTLGNSSDAFLLLRLQQAGIDVALLPFLWSGLHVVKSVSVYWFGMLSDHVGRRPLLLAGWGLYTVIYVGFAIASSPLAVAAIFLFYGLFYGMTEGAERALVGDLVEPAERGLAFGIYNGAIGIAALPASVVMGAMWQAYGFESAFLLGAALALVATIVLVAGVSVPVTNDSRT